jgi:hypothetical protein
MIVAVANTKDLQCLTEKFATQRIIQPADDIFFNSGLVPKTKLISDAGLDPNNLPKNGDEFLK